MRGVTLAARDRRALTLGGLIALPVLLWTLAVAPYVRALADARDQVEGGRAVLARELGVLAAAHQYPALADEGARALRRAAPHLLDAGSAGVASASLVAYVQSRARESRVRVTELAPQSDSAASQGVLPVSLRVEGKGSLEALLTFLQSLEMGPKLVRVDGLEIEATEMIGTGMAEGDDRTADVLVFGLMATGFAPAPPVVVATADAAQASGR
ncbi:MAG TPA: type II secretion system protein GspM [Gemmatimonadaceae bacterium]|nr:type II secretion system protein GspM [Gemmatimonadaceae bacterium]